MNVTVTLHISDDALEGASADEVRAALTARLDECYPDNAQGQEIAVPLTVQEITVDDSDRQGRQTIVQTTIAAFRAAGLTAEWTHTGGGCYAIEVTLPEGRYAYVVNGGEYGDVYTAHDYASDDEVTAEWRGGVYDANAEDVRDLPDTDDVFVMIAALREEAGL